MEAVRDYGKLAAEIKRILGEENILSATHCATRLRLVLKSEPTEKETKAIEQMPGVIQIVKAGGQFQIVIGMHAKDVYEELCKIMTFSEDAPAIKQNAFDKVIAMMSGCIAPFVYVLAGAGLLQGVLIIIRLFADISGTGASQIYDMISWTPFTFLPVFIAVAGAKHFRCNVYIALWCCLALTNPTWASICDTITAGTKLHFIAVPLTNVTYTSTVIPPLVLVGLLSVLERKVAKILPDTFRPLLQPVICAAIMVPLTICVIGPISSLVANGLAFAYQTAYDVVPWLTNGVLAFFWQVFVIFGVHWSFTPIALAEMANNGFSLFQPMCGIAVCAQTAACFAVFLKSKNKKVKGIAASAAATGLFGITEPAIYGVTLRFKKPFFCGAIGAAIGGIIASFFGTRYFVYAGLCGFLSIPNAIYDTNALNQCAKLGTDNPAFTMGVIGLLIGTAVACIVSVGLVMIVGFEEPVEVQSEDKITNTEAKSEKISATA